MKKLLRVLIPLILAVALIGCTAWYLFYYDRDFTRDILLQQARNMESSGHHALSKWFYNAAYAHADNDETVAIELAEQYKANGNYTKAEYTLTNAIADGGTAKLYMALCRTYIEQDKLLDAINMLDNIGDSAIKRELDALRPSAPIADPVPGFYSQYIDVTLSSDSGTLYVSTNSQYPSIADAPHTGAITLGGGETTIYALSVGDDGLVSPLSVFGYTVGGVIEPVVFTDPAFEAEIRSLLKVEDDRTIYTNELWTITALTMPENAENYEDLKYLPYLEKLIIRSGVASELENLVSLGLLRELHLYDCRPSENDLKVIGTLSNLQKLTLENCGLSTIEPLSSLQALEYLNLADNTLRNISILSSMPLLREVNLQHNAISDLSAMSNLNNLVKLDVSNNDINSIAPICTLKNLNQLKVDNNNLVSLSGISNLNSLTVFTASHNALTDVNDLTGCTALQTLDISNNALTDITALSVLNNLAYFTFKFNQITALPAWDKDCALLIIDGEANLISNLEPLSGLLHLNRVYMRFNTEITSVDPLANCPTLVEVDVWGSKVSNASSLLEQSIIVTFDPTLGKTVSE